MEPTAERRSQRRLTDRGPTNAGGAREHAAEAPQFAASGVVLRLQRAVGNRAVAQLLNIRRAPDPVPSAPAKGQPAPGPRVSYVFIVGDVSNDTFYKNAKGYFEQEVKSAKVVTGKRTLEAIIDHVNSGGKPVDTLYIVSHANEMGDLDISVDAADLRADLATTDKRPRLEYSELKQANANAGGFPATNLALIDEKTKIEIRGCDIGRSQLMLDELDKAFGGKSQVTAPTHHQDYVLRGSTGKFEENLSKYFIEAPGDVKKSSAELQSEFQKKYPFVSTKQWPGLLKQVKREKTKLQYGGWAGTQPPKDDAKTIIGLLHANQKFPSSAGWALTYTGRSRVGDEYQYTVRADRVTKNGGTEFQEVFLTAKVPPTEQELLTKWKAENGRPDAFKWSVMWSASGMDVFIEQTEWTIDAELASGAGPVHPPETDKSFYGKSQFTPPTAPHP